MLISLAVEHEGQATGEEPLCVCGPDNKETL